MRLHSYSLMRDVAAALARPAHAESAWQSAPLVVLNNFSSGGEPLSLLATLFQGLFPTINVQITQLRSCKVSIHSGLLILSCPASQLCCLLRLIHPEQKGTECCILPASLAFERSGRSASCRPLDTCVHRLGLHHRLTVRSMLACIHQKAALPPNCQPEQYLVTFTCSWSQDGDLSVIHA